MQDSTAPGALKLGWPTDGSFGMGSGVAWQPLLPGGAFTVPGGWVCSPLPTNGSVRLVQEEERNPPQEWPEILAEAAAFWGSLPGLGP